MVFKGILNAETTAKLTAQFTCEFPCRGVVDITSLIGAVGVKTTFKIPLACFVPGDAQAGQDFTNVNAPFQLQTTQALDFTFAEVEWVQGAANDPDAADCATLGVATPAAAGGKPLSFLSESNTLRNPYILYVGSQADFAVPVEGGALPPLDGVAHTAEPADFLMTLAAGPAVTVNQPGDGKNTTWTGSAQVYLQAPDRDPLTDGNQGWDLSGYLNSGGMLAFDAKVNAPPTGNVTARIDCAYPCRGELNATALFTDPTLADGNAHTFKIPLDCFHTAGADFTQINTPFLLVTDQPFELTFANVRWLPGPVSAGAATCANGTLTP